MKQCKNIQVVYADQSQLIHLEKRCVLNAGHQGPHTDGKGAVWLNGPDLRRMIEQRVGEQPKTIVDLGAKKT